VRAKRLQIRKLKVFVRDEKKTANTAGRSRGKHGISHAKTGDGKPGRGRKRGAKIQRKGLRERPEKQKKDKKAPPKQGGKKK